MRIRTFSWCACLSFWVGCSAVLLAGADARDAPYRLTIAGDRVSLEVTDGPMVALIEDLGRRLGFEVVAEGVDDIRVTARFEGLSPRDAIREICKPVTYLEIPDPESGRTARLVLISAKPRTMNRAAAGEPVVLRAPLPVDLPPPLEPETPEPVETKDDD